MQFLTIFLFVAPAVYACGDSSYRCKNPGVSANKEWQVTHRICNDLKEDTCFCSKWSQDYCDTIGDNIQKFKSQCEAEGESWYWSGC
jgi:hypothetical protein